MTYALSECTRALAMAQEMVAGAHSADDVAAMLDRAERLLAAAEDELAEQEPSLGREAVRSALALRARLDRLRWTLGAAGVA